MNKLELASHIDVTLVQTNHTITEIDSLIQAAKKYKFACGFTLPCYMEHLKRALAGSGVHTGGVIGFPSGGEFTETKLFEARRNVELGAEEIDMVINVGWLLSAQYDKVCDEIKAIKDIIGSIPLKCIMEISLLTEDNARRAAEIIAEGGAEYIKTGTGWIAPTTVEHVRLIKSAIGDAALIKAAGGIRNQSTAEEFLNAGAYRLGIGLASAVSICEAML